MTTTGSKRPCWCGASDHAVNACGQFAPDGGRLPDPSLLPCPCGAPAGVAYYPRRDYWVAGCTACPTSAWGETRAEACAVWNAAKPVQSSASRSDER